MEQHTVRLLVPDSQAGGLIGKGGAMINAIRTQSGAHVKVANKGEMGHGVMTFANANVKCKMKYKIQTCNIVVLVLILMFIFSIVMCYYYYYYY